MLRAHAKQTDNPRVGAVLVARYEEGVGVPSRVVRVGTYQWERAKDKAEELNTNPDVMVWLPQVGKLYQ